MSSHPPNLPPLDPQTHSQNEYYGPHDGEDDNDHDTASQRSISLSSNPPSPRATSPHFSATSPPHDTHPLSISPSPLSPSTSYSTYPPPPIHAPVSSKSSSSYAETDRASITSRTDAASITSIGSYARKVRPESTLMEPGKNPLVLGIAVVDFDHAVGPRIEMAHPKTLLDDEEMCKILPFLALPDGAHLSKEDYSYFHIVPSKPHPTPSSPLQTVFGISCNRQISSSSLLQSDPAVTRSTVQKAVVVLASKPLFGPIRDKLGVVTRAYFNQRSFKETDILIEFYDGLELSLRSQLTESGVYMGTSLRELVHKFRHRTLILLKLLILQRKILFFGHPVERLCTYQYSLVSLIPGLLLGLEDSGSPTLSSRAQQRKKSEEVRSSSRQSLMRFMGFPLEVFGKDSFFQPYLPLQQVDMLKSESYLCGTTNSIVTQQRDSTIDLLVNIEQNTFEFHSVRLERVVGLTPEDRKWMDEIVRDVNDSWVDSPEQEWGGDEAVGRVGGGESMGFKGSEDYLRNKFEDYVASALSCIKYSDFLIKTQRSDMIVSGISNNPNPSAAFGEAWIGAFRSTSAYEIWDRITDPVIFDIVEPRHPCDVPPTPISDISIRLQEGIHSLQLEQNLGPTRDAIQSAASGFFKAVRSEIGTRFATSGAATTPTSPTAPETSPPGKGLRTFSLKPTAVLPSGLRPLSLPLQRSATPPPPIPPTSSYNTAPIPPPPMSPLPSTPSSFTPTIIQAQQTLGSWGAGLGSFISSRAAKISATVQEKRAALSSPSTAAPPSTLSGTKKGIDEEWDDGGFVIRDLDREREELERAKMKDGSAKVL